MKIEDLKVGEVYVNKNNTNNLRKVTAIGKNQMLYQYITKGGKEFSENENISLIDIFIKQFEPAPKKLKLFAFYDAHLGRFFFNKEEIYKKNTHYESIERAPEYDIEYN